MAIILYYYTESVSFKTNYVKLVEAKPILLAINVVKESIFGNI